MIDLQEDGWVVCRVFKKKNLFKVGGNGSSSSEAGGHHNAGGMMMMIPGASNDSSGHQFNNRSSTSTSYNNQYSRPATAYSHRDPTLNNSPYWLQQPFHHQGDQNLSYMSHIASIDNAAATHHQYQQLEAQNLFSGAGTSNQNLMKPLMLSGTSSYHDHHHLSALDPTLGADHHQEDYQQQDQSPALLARSMQVKQFMSSNASTRDDGDGSSSPPGYKASEPEQSSDDQNHLNEWDGLAITNNQQTLSSKGLEFQEGNPSTSSSNQIDHLTLRSETNFWGYGK